MVDIAKVNCIDLGVKQRLSRCVPWIRLCLFLDAACLFPSFLPSVYKSSIQHRPKSSTFTETLLGWIMSAAVGRPHLRSAAREHHHLVQVYRVAERWGPSLSVAQYLGYQGLRAQPEGPGRSAPSLAQKGKSELDATRTKTQVRSVNVRDQNAVVGGKTAYSI